MDFMETQDVLEPQKARTRRLLSSWTFIDVTCTFEASPQEEVDTAELEVHCEVAEDEAAALKKKESKTKPQAWNRLRTERLGTDPREVRAAL